MGISAFTKTGNTVVFTATTSAPTPVQAVSTTLGGNQYRIVNAGTFVVFMGYGTSAADATSRATVTTSTNQAFPLLPGTDEILSFMPNAYFTGILASGGGSLANAAVYITPGDGA